MYSLPRLLNRVFYRFCRVIKAAVFQFTTVSASYPIVILSITFGYSRAGNVVIQPITVSIYLIDRLILCLPLLGGGDE